VPRKRKVVYPPSRSSKGTPPPPRVQTTPPTVAVINQGARKGRDDIVEGAWVTITGTGSNAGESGRVDRLVPGVIPAAVVSLEGGRTRRVRTVDLVPSRRVEAPVEPAPADSAPKDSAPKEAASEA
jgi:hypothetical protein